ncbi:MAG: MFS transporter [Candidatus Lokiarchaeota archaeon]|nr:MFS transporter [Candidatus Lokiarchaeota archaeon]
MGEKNIDGGTVTAMPRRNKIFFSLGEVGDNVAYQTFSFLVFTYYFAIVRLPVLWISAGFIIWAVWNAVNDNLIGIVSDRTKTRFGRRRPWMIVAVVPLAMMMVLLFTVPPGDDVVHFVYFLCVLFIFDGVYSMFNVNYNALFSEMFVSMKDRSDVGRLRSTFVVVALVLALALPSIIIEDMANEHGYPYTADQYLTSGIIAGIIVVVVYSLVIKLGVEERVEFSKDSESAPSFGDSVKFTFKNKSFRIFLVAAMAMWICNGILPSMFPLFAAYAIGISDPTVGGILLLLSFIVGAVTMPLWAHMRKKRGARFVGIVALAWWGVSLLLLMMSWNVESGIVFMLIMGFGLGGSIYFYDQCIAEIIDEDEVTLGIRRSGSYYGVITFIIRLSMVLNFVIVGLLFTGAEWSVFTPNPGVEPVMALRFLIGIYPAIVLTFGLVSLWKYPIHGARLQEIRGKLDELHSKKRSDASRN